MRGKRSAIDLPLRDRRELGLCVRERAHGSIDSGVLIANKWLVLSQASHKLRAPQLCSASDRLEGKKAKGGARESQREEDVKRRKGPNLSKLAAQAHDSSVAFVDRGN